jgi:hypothetical protein
MKLRFFLRSARLAFLLAMVMACGASLAVAQTPRADGMRFIPDVAAQFNALTEHPEALGMHLGASPNPSICKHYQAMIRINGPDGTPYFYMSRSGNVPGFTGASIICAPVDSPGETGNGHLVIFKMGSRDKTGERLRSNRMNPALLIDKTVPPINDAQLKYFTVLGGTGADPGLIPNDAPPGSPKVYQHPGGMQAVGTMLAVGMDTPKTSGIAKSQVLFFDVSDPENPVMKSRFNPHKSTTNTPAEELGDVDALGLTPLASDRYLLSVYSGFNDSDDGKDANIYFYRSNVVGGQAVALSSPDLSWELVGTTPGPRAAQVKRAHQCLQLLRQGDINGQLYMAGSGGFLAFPDEDRMSLYTLNNTSANWDPNGTITLTPARLNKRMSPAAPTGGPVQADLAAGAGYYISLSGELIFYCCKHDNDGPNISDPLATLEAAEWRHINMVRDNSPTYSPSAALMSPAVVDEGGIIPLAAAAQAPLTKAWIQLFNEENYGDPAHLADPAAPEFSTSSVVVDFDDRTKEDFANLLNVDATPPGDPCPVSNSDQAQSWKWYAPLGCSIKVWDHSGGQSITLVGDGLVHSDPVLPTIMKQTIDGVEFLNNCDQYYTTFSPSLSPLQGVGSSSEFDASELNGPSVSDVVMRTQLQLGGPISTTKAKIYVRNVAPAISSLKLLDHAGKDVLPSHLTVEVGQIVTLGAAFHDPGKLDHQTSSLNWGDGTVEDGSAFLAFKDSYGGGAGSITHVHRFTTPGEYPMALSVTDDDGGVDSQTAIVSVVPAANGGGGIEEKSTGIFTTSGINQTERFVIDQDANNSVAGYTRDLISVTATARVSAASGETGTQTFAVFVELHDEADNVLDLKNGVKGRVSLGTQSVTFSFFTTTALRTWSGSVAPAEKMLSTKLYHPVFFLTRVTPTAAALATANTSVGEQWLHFTNIINADAPVNVIASSTFNIGRSIIITGEPGQAAFQASVVTTAFRYDGFDDVTTTNDVNFTSSIRLLDVDAGNVAVPITGGSISETAGLSNHTNAALTAPSVATLRNTFSFLPGNLATFDFTHHYKIELTSQHVEAPGAPVTDSVVLTPATQFLRLSGVITGGGATGTLHQVTNIPSFDASGNGTLLIPAGQGTIPGVPNYTFGSTSAQPVTVNFQTGDVTIQSGGSFDLVDTTGAGEVVAAGVRVQLDFPAFGSNGFTAAQATVKFPVGFGTAATATSRRLAASKPLSIGNFFLLNNLLLPPNATYSFSCAYAAIEGTPLRFTGSSVTWNVAAGTFTMPNGTVNYERSAEVASLAADAAVSGRLVSLTEGNRTTNDGYLRGATTGNCSISASATGAAVMTGSVNIPAGTSNSHFPSGNFFQWTAASTVTWTNGVEGGGLNLISNAVSQRQDHATAVPGDPCSATSPQQIGAVADADNNIVRTVGGGLRVEGTRSGEIRWGGRGSDYGWKLQGPFTASIYVPGYVFNGATAYGGQAAAALLLTGRGQPGNLSYTELPNTAAYNTGAADYAGMNVRISQNTGVTCRQLPGALTTATPAGVPVVYTLKPCSKYIVRGGGVSGRHEALTVPNSDVPLWGFTSHLNDIAVTFLDSRVKDAGGRALLTIGTDTGPAKFNVNLEKLYFGGTGELREASIAAGSPAVNLSYWSVNVQPLTCDFRFADQATAPGCENRDQGFPVLGVSCKTPYLREPLTGALGFTTTGNLMAASNPLAAGTGVDSRLRVPSQMRVEGNGGTKAFTLTPVTKVTFNNFDATDKPPGGFLSLAGKLDVPFFEDVPVSVHLRPSLPDQIYVMAGWTDPNGKTAFQDTDFDSTNHGWPAGVTLDEFRSPTVVTSPFHPEVQRKWKGLDLKFGVHWEPLRRQFLSVRPNAPQTIFVLNVPTELRTLSPTVADIGFSISAGQLPTLSTKQLIADEAEGFGNLQAALHNAVNSAGNAAFNAAKIPQAMTAIEEMMDFDPSKLLDPALNAILPPAFVDRLYDELLKYYCEANGDVTNLCTNLTNATGGAGGFSFKDALTLRLGLLGDVNNATGAVASMIRPRLQSAKDGIDAILELIRKDGTTQERVAVKRLVLELMNAFRHQGGVAGTLAGLVIDGAADIINDTVNTEVPQSEQAYLFVERVLTRLRTRIVELDDQVVHATGFMQNLATNGIPLPDVELTVPAGMADQVIQRICDFLQRQLDTAARFVQDRPQEVKDFLRNTIKEFVINNVLVTKMRAIVRNVGSEIRETLVGGLDAVLAEAGRIIDLVFNKAKARIPAIPNVEINPGAFNGAASALNAANISGYARINGDTLEELRIDGKYTMKDPDPMEFSGWLLVKNITSTAGASDCHLAGANGVEISLGASAPLAGLGFSGGSVDGDSNSGNRPKPKVDVSLLFALNGSGVPVGADGRFDVTGPLVVGPVKLNRISLGAGIGGCNYLFGHAVGSFRDKEADVAFFVGSNTHIGDLGIMRPEVHDLIGNLDQRVRGFYVEASAWVSLNEMFGIPDSCFFRAHAKFGGGLFGFNHPNNGGGTSAGVIVDLGVKAEILCLVTASAELIFVPQVSFGANSSPRDNAAASGTVFDASALLKLSAKLGVCPFCKTVSKDFRAHAHVTSNSFDLSF